MSLLKRSALFLILVCLGCSAQSSLPADLNRRIERQIRSSLGLPAFVQIQIGDRKPSDFPNYDQVTITLNGGDRKVALDYLLSKDSKTLIRVSEKMDLSKDPYAEVMKKIDITGRPFRGGKDAKVVIVNYDDFQCPYCTQMHQTLMSDVVSHYGDKIKVVYKDFPLFQIHPWANRAAIDGNCVGALSNDAYWAFADEVHASGAEISQNSSGGRRPLEEQFAMVDKIALQQISKFNIDGAKLAACLKQQPDAAVRASVKEAAEVGVDSTPTLFINGEKINGALPAEQIRAIIDRLLSEAALPGQASTVPVK